MSNNGDRIFPSSKQLQLVIDHIPQAIFWKDRNSIYLGCNQKFALDAGTTPEEIIGKSDFDLCSTKEEARNSQESDRRIRKSNTPEFNIIKTKLQANGTKKWFKSNKIPLYDDFGNSLGILGTYEDITAQKETEELLKQQSLAMDAALDGIAILVEDRIVYLNQSYTDILGYQSTTELLGQIWHTIYDEEEKQRIERETLPILQHKGHWRGKMRAKRQDGSYFIQEISLTLVENGSVICICRDISKQEVLLRDRNLAEVQLNNSIKELANFKYALDRSSIIAMTDAKGVITYVNNNFCKISQYNPEELIGKTHRIINSGHHDRTFFKNLWKVISQGKIWQGEIQNRAKDGSYYWVNTTVVPFLDGGDKPFQYLSIREDITDRKKTEIALANELKFSQSLEKVTQVIRQSLDTKVIFNTATQEIRQRLQVDRVGIFQFEPDTNYYWGEFVAEDVGSEFPSAMEISISKYCVGDEFAVNYFAGEFVAINDIYESKLSNFQINILEKLQIKSNLALPLFQDKKLWGLLCLHQCSQPRRWQDLEIKLVRKIANQLSISLRKAKLLEQEKEQRINLQKEVSHRQAAESALAKELNISQLLEKVTEAIRKSLDTQTIFNTATQEIRQVLQADRVGIFRFEPNTNYHWGEFIAEDVIEEFSSAIAIPVRDRCFGDECAVDYTQGKFLAINNIYDDNLSDCHIAILEQFQIKANLVIPLLEDEILWGLLCIHQCSQPRQWQTSEIELVQKIASRMNIALYQAKLLEREKLKSLELENALTKADAANKAKSTFLANMSHELRTPLNAILGFSQLLQRDSAITTEQQTTLGIINRSGEHLLKLINDVLEMSKIEAGKITFNYYDFDLDGLLESLQQMFCLKAKSKGLELTIEREASVLRYIRTDESKLRQILINLLSNGIKFTTVGKVSLQVLLIDNNIESDVKTQLLKFVVRDTGVGIAKDEIKDLFRPFSQTKSGLQSQEGTGLGLSLSHKLIQLMEGELVLETTLGKGTTFSFTMPIVEAKEIQIIESKKEKAIALAPDQPNYLILVVEDKWESRKLLVQLLESIGFTVKEAENGQEAVEMWEKWQPDLIWMDIKMPVMDGYESTRIIREKQQKLATKINTVIIALTASAFKEEREGIIQAGCNDFMCKPFQESALLEKIKQYLNLEYIYKPIEGGMETDAEDKDTILNTQDVIKIMKNFDTNWLQQMHDAALGLDEDFIFESISEIATEYNELANTLETWIELCQFDLLLQCTQELI